jgi:putative hydrolase of the HAD superfamily
MRQVGIWNLFDDIFISSDHEKKKPQPEFMEELLKKHNIDRDRAVMIGNDFTSDIRIALECDMESIFLNTDRHSEAEMKSLLAKQKAQKPSEKEVYIISSGDIKEIL